tara:strand:+ start:131 stop:685 length:555 start_codon:yes stop_codon:yes gene_type:complete
MLWYKEFKNNMPQDLKSMCIEYTQKFNHEPFWTYKSVANSKMWTIPPLGENRRRMYDEVPTQVLENISNFKKMITDITKLELENDSPVDCIWRFDENFTSCPIHTDAGGEHTGSVVTSVVGNFKIHLHVDDFPNSPIIDSVDVNESNLIVLNNTVYPHSVEGQGDLLVFGAEKYMKPEEYFKNE